MAAHRAAPTGAGTPGSATHGPGSPAALNVEKRLRRLVRMLGDVQNAIFHVGDAAHCDVRGRKGRRRGTRGGKHKARRLERGAGYSDGSPKEGSSPELHEESMGWATEWSAEKMDWVAVVNRGENLDKMRARQAEARARKAEEENRLLQKRVKLMERKVGGEEVTVRDCIKQLDTEEFHDKPLDEVLQRLEARWLHASAAEKFWRDDVKHPVHGSDAKVGRAEQAIKRIKKEYEAKFVGLQGQLQAAQVAATAAVSEAAAAAAARRVAAQATAAEEVAVAEKVATAAAGRVAAQAVAAEKAATEGAATVTAAATAAAAASAEAAAEKAQAQDRALAGAAAAAEAEATAAENVAAKKTAPSAYGLFMKAETSRIMESEPTLSRRGAFAQAAVRWEKLKATARREIDAGGELISPAPSQVEHRNSGGRGAGGSGGVGGEASLETLMEKKKGGIEEGVVVVD